MKLKLLIPLVVLLFAGWHVVSISYAQNANSNAAPNTLSDEQVEALVTERPTPDGGSIRFSARARQNQRLTPDQRQNHINAETIPFQITADVFAMAANGRRGARVNGNVSFYVLDSDGKIVDSGKRTVRQMCPT